MKSRVRLGSRILRLVVRGLLLCAPFLSYFQLQAQVIQRIATPSEFLGFEVGSDHKVADYRQISSYFEMLAQKSSRFQVQHLGSTTLGNDFIMGVISSEQNLKDIRKYKEIAHRLADPRGLSQAEIDSMAHQGKVIVLVTCNLHSEEFSSSQMALEWAHDLATSQDPKTVKILNRVILLLVPSLNPDGQIMISEWYRKYVGTRYEGGDMPWLYHHYVGHDNNRDWFMLTQKETKAMTGAVYTEWFPNIWLDEHEQESNGPRLSVPPYSDPVSDVVSPLLWRGVDAIGMNMSWRLEQAHKSGVIYGYVYDGYAPGQVDTNPWWKNIFSLIIEAASARIATPVKIEPGELRGNPKGLVEYGRRMNYPDPWPGGWWRMRDIMDYERIASDALLEEASERGADFMSGTAAMAMESVQQGSPNEFYWIPFVQRDPVTAANLAHLLREQGIEVFTAADGFYIPTAQPYGRYATELLTRQFYPEVKAVPGSNIIPPYDVTSWTLPLMMGVTVESKSVDLSQTTAWKPVGDKDGPKGAVESAGPWCALTPERNNATRLINALMKEKADVSVAAKAFQSGSVSFPAGTFVFQSRNDLTMLAEQYEVKLQGLPAKPAGPTFRLREPRVGLYKPWIASIDEGWTRWLLEQYGFNLKDLDNVAVKKGNLNAAYDVIVLPDIAKDEIVDGKARADRRRFKYFEDLPPEYSGGIGKEGSYKLKEFVANGGTIVALAASGEFLTDEFSLPVRNVLADAGVDTFNSPGSLLRIDVDTTNPVGYGMPSEIAGFLDRPIAYQTELPGPDVERSVISWYPQNGRDVLLSGWLKGSDLLARRASAVSFVQGKGKLVLLGFRVQFRGQTEGTYKLLFNSIRWAASEPIDTP